MSERRNHALSIARCASRNKLPNDQAQRRGRNAKESSSRLVRVRCSALLGVTGITPDDFARDLYLCSFHSFR
jgi:hypothetical protein